MITESGAPTLVRKQFRGKLEEFSRELAALTSMPALVGAAIPTLRRYDPEQLEIETAYVDASITLRGLFGGRAHRTLEVSTWLARVMARLHGLKASTAAGFQSITPPFVFSLDHPDRGLLTRGSAASIALVRQIQANDPLRSGIQAASAAWTATVITHNDLKWDNILVHPREGETEPTQVTIIDWEMAGIGDPCWDVGTVLGEFLAFWALSIPIIAGEPVDRYMHLAKYPIEEMQPAIRAFWGGYVGAMGFDPATARERLVKATRFAGARLIQTAYERTQTMSQLTPHIYLLLQLSLNVMEQPEDAAEHLLAIAPDGGFPS